MENLFRGRVCLGNGSIQEERGSFAGLADGWLITHREGRNHGRRDNDSSATFCISKALKIEPPCMAYRMSYRKEVW